MEQPMHPTYREPKAGNGAETSAKHDDGTAPSNIRSAVPIKRALVRVVGFLAGFLGAFALLAAFFDGTRLVPRGPGWVFLLIGAGVVGSRVAAYFTNEDNIRQLGGHWWELDQTFRLVLVVGAVWAATFFLLLEEVNLKAVLLPPLALVVLFFAYHHLVDRPQGSQRPDA